MIIPAILETTTEGFNEKLSLIKGLKVIRVQVDFCDGQFVEKRTLSVDQIGSLKGGYEWEAHVMASNPINFEDYKNAGFSHIIVHYEAFDSELLLEEALTDIAQLGLTPALAINPETPVSVVRYFTDTITNFTVMSVIPGKQGQPFIDETYARVSELREMASDATIEVDGGINSTNAPRLIAAGANHLAVGSALFETEDIKQNYKNVADAIK